MSKSRGASTSVRVASARTNGRPPASAASPLEVLKKAPTGIGGFDEITGGGLPKGRPTLLCGGAGCGKTLFALEFLIRGALELIRDDYEERSWKAFWKVAVDGQSPADVAAEFGLTVFAVYQIKYRLTQRLRHELAGLVE